MIVMEPGYRQVSGIGRNAGCEVEAFHLRRENGWRPDLEELDTAGAAVDADDCRYQSRIIRWVRFSLPRRWIASSLPRRGPGAWLLADEVYRGTERISDQETASFYQPLRARSVDRQHVQSLRPFRLANRMAGCSAWT